MKEKLKVGCYVLGDDPKAPDEVSCWEIVESYKQVVDELKSAQKSYIELHTTEPKRIFFSTRHIVAVIEP